MQIDWDESLNTGDRELDVHHQAFFIKAQQMADACRGGRGKFAVTEMLDFLAEYALHHFRVEEQRMEACQFPYARTHLAQHADFLERLGAIKTKLERKGPTPVLADEVRDLALTWLLDHIKGSDMPLVEFIKEQQRQGSGSAA